MSARSAASRAVSETADRVATGDRAPMRLERLDLRPDPPDAATTEAWRRLVRRGATPDATVRAAVRTIIEAVRSGRAAAVREANRRFGGGLADDSLLIEAPTLLAARDALAPEVRAALETAIANVRTFAQTQLPPSSIRTETQPGVEIERRWTPLASVGAYVPGGSAPYPSSLVMAVVPARVVGVERVVVATPAGADGRVDPVLLGAAGLLGVDTVLVAGGAQAIAALAFGLHEEGFARVDRIVGPGNAFVTAAKIELVGEVGIDLPAGPSEGMVLSDPPSDPVIAAADLITQAEHGPDSPALLVTTDPAFADVVERAIGDLLRDAPRREILERSLGEHGRVILVADLDGAIRAVNDYAPEHLSVDVEPLEETVGRVTNAGSIFVGPWAPESAGDYATGANHVLPTGGLARSTGPLAVEAFGRFSQVQRITREGLAGLRQAVTTLAAAEGLDAHRNAVDIRFEREDR